MWKHLATALALLGAAACTTTSGPAPRPDFSRRAAPPVGQSEIELLAGISGALVIDRDTRCLGLQAAPRASEFVTIVWPSNAELEWASGRWQVRNTETGEVIQVGSQLRGSGGYTGKLSGASLRSFNRFLVKDLSTKCAALGAFTLNRDFGPG